MATRMSLQNMAETKIELEMLDSADSHFADYPSFLFPCLFVLCLLALRT